MTHSGPGTRQTLARPPRIVVTYGRIAASALRESAGRTMNRLVPDPLADRFRATRPDGVEVAPTDLVMAVEGIRVDPARATAFAGLIGAPVTARVHPGYVHVLAFPVAVALMARDEVPMSLLGAVHLANRIVQHRPVRANERLDVEATVSEPRPHRRGTVIDVTATVRVAGEVVLTDVSTYLSRSPGPVDGQGTDQASDGAGTRPPRPEYAPPEATEQWHLGAHTGRRYAKVSGDWNPIHLAAALARAFGFPRAIVQGMYSASRALTSSGISLAGPLTWQVSFEAPILLPSSPQVAHTAGPDGAVATEVWRAATPDRPARRHLFARATPRVG